GVSVAVTEESGLKDRITDSLDGWMRKIGLNESYMQFLHTKGLCFTDLLRFGVQLPDWGFSIDIQFRWQAVAVFSLYACPGPCGRTSYPSVESKSDG
ncbi:hypothetical protein PC115_g25501, partial [Phytophthora cactorum]